MLKKNSATEVVVSHVDLVRPYDHTSPDEFAGHGGSYVYDPARGVRVPAKDVTQRPAAEGEQGNE